ncbi:MAG: BamA/TamA family outer membrane protein, partial [Gammaproteobacteria bacterium]
ENLKLATTTYSPTQVFDFINQYGRRFSTLTLNASWAHDTRNRAVLADRGMLQRFSLEAAVPTGGLEYYKLSYDNETYVPLTQALTLSLSAKVGYGNGYGKFSKLPFFENYYAGGVHSVRGYQDNTLGPRDSNNNPIGGSLKVTGSAAVLFPVPFAPDSKSFRLSTFFDFGNVYAKASDFKASDLRYSVGLSAIWMSPLGPLTFSVAKPLNSKPGDQTQVFQFALGSFF